MTGRDERLRVSRRKLLAGITGVGAAGAASGFGTTALFGDRETVGARLAGGTLDLAVDWEVRSGPTAGETGSSHGDVSIPVGDIDEDHSEGSVLLTLDLPDPSVNNPAYLWLRTDCPDPAATTLGEVLTVELSYADCETGEQTEQIAAGSLREVADALRWGVPIDGDPGDGDRSCLDPGSPVCLLLSWSAESYLGHETTTLDLGFAGQQCRHDDGTSSPFPDEGRPECPAGDPCPCCAFVGKLELEDGEQDGVGDSYVEPGVYEFTEGSNAYRLEVTETVTKDGGSETVAAAFTLIDADGNPAPNLCSVAVKGGPDEETYERADGQLSSGTDSLDGGEGDDGLLYAPVRSGSGDSPGDYFGISHVSVSVCAAERDGGCP